ncbi:uncharacterized protein SAZU_0172 [Streptomyces azureus]|uniref:Uncharacterized protein n=1 Tax=Streptomyces azureus TaxID=146537 RepID=A0A0K8PCH2_STRAJ|nr:uncharacterized protein SAZU_0172 [Streptomyces azureus]
MTHTEGWSDVIVAVAVLLLPVLAGLLAGMAWWEERLFRPSDAPRHAGTRRHLRLIRGERDAPAHEPHTGARRRHAA